MADSYGKIGNNRITKLPAKRESPSGSYLSSDSVRDCRMRRRERVRIRVRSNVGVTGGYVAGALGNASDYAPQPYDPTKTRSYIRKYRSV